MLKKTMYSFAICLLILAFFACNPAEVTTDSGSLAIQINGSKGLSVTEYPVSRLLIHRYPLSRQVHYHSISLSVQVESPKVVLSKYMVPKLRAKLHSDSALSQMHRKTADSRHTSMSNTLLIRSMQRKSASISTIYSYHSRTAERMP